MRTSSFWVRYKLQQDLPFTVLKLSNTNCGNVINLIVLQQRLPFTVLKLNAFYIFAFIFIEVATAFTVYGIETLGVLHKSRHYDERCNSTYRLRY